MDDRRIGSVVVALVLIGLSFLNDTRGYLGTDTGGKTATLEAMVRRDDWSVDVGYWAEEHDPDGTYHPLFGTRRTDEGWVQVTSLPLVLAARPFYDVGGYRAALLLPIAGTVGAALAAAALAERIRDRRAGTTAFWVFGLGSPLMVYGLDLWEHSIGVALIGWAAVQLHDVVFRDTGARLSSPVASAHSLVAGMLLGAAATMRTEALVYTAVLVGATCVCLVVRRRLPAAVTCGAAATAGFAIVWLLNSVLEDRLGGQTRAGRASGAASAGGSELGERVEEGLRTTFATAATESWRPVVLGAVLTVVVVIVVDASDRLSPARFRLVVPALGVFTLLTVVGGLGFVPGLFAAFPLAAAGLAVRRVPRSGHMIVAAALTALPLVWAFQFVGGAGPQWAGRYLLPSSFLLGVAGVAALVSKQVPRAVTATLLTMSVAVNLFGIVWLRDRSHEVAALLEAVEDAQEGALIARNEFFLREFGPAGLDERWLSASNPADLQGPADVLRDAGVTEFSVLQVEGQPAPEIDGAAVTDVSRISALGVVFEVVDLRLDG